MVKIDWLLTLLLISVPLSRELLFGLIDHHHVPFSSASDLVHTGLEMVFMAIVGIGLSLFRQRHKAVKIDKKILEELVSEKVREIEVTQQTTIEALATLADYRNRETGEHLARLQEYTYVLTKHLAENSAYSHQISNQDNYITDIGRASILHDVGKVTIPDAILLKSDKLSPEEFAIMKNHTLAAGDILEKANLALLKQFKKDSYLSLAQQIAYYHHERWDGTGYPFELQGEQIPLCARIVSLCDVYDALTGNRGYKTSWSHEQARIKIEQESGTIFDPTIVEAFLQVEANFAAICQQHQKLQQASENS